MEKEKKPLNFIEQIIEEDLAKGLSRDKIRFRFPPEPNGYLHIGHIKAICINFGLGEKYNAPVFIIEALNPFIFGVPIYFKFNVGPRNSCFSTCTILEQTSESAFTTTILTVDDVDSNEITD